MAVDPFDSPLVHYKLDEPQNASVWKDSAGRYDLNQFAFNSKGYPKMRAGFRETSKAREFTRRDETTLSGVTIGTQIARNDSFSPAILGELSAGEWTCGFWFKRVTPAAGETNTGGYVFCVNGREAAIADPYAKGRAVALAIRIFSVGGGGITPGTPQILWSKFTPNVVTNAGLTFSTYQPPLDTWTHLTFQRRIVGSSSHGYLYVNGVYTAPFITTASIGNYDVYPPLEARFALGALMRERSSSLPYIDQITGPLAGSVDDFRLWRGLLTDAQILTLATPPFRNPVLTVTYPGT